MIILSMFVGWRERYTRIFRDQAKTQMNLINTRSPRYVVNIPLRGKEEFKFYAFL